MSNLESAINDIVEEVLEYHSFVERNDIEELSNEISELKEQLEYSLPEEVEERVNVLEQKLELYKSDFKKLCDHVNLLSSKINTMEDRGLFSQLCHRIKQVF